MRLLLNIFKSTWELGKFLRAGRNANVTPTFRKEELEIDTVVNLILMPRKVVWQVSWATPSRYQKDEKVFGISMGLWRNAQ